MKKLPALIALLFFALLIIFDFSVSSCATVGRPTGGPRDTLAPALDTSFPANLTTHFNQKKVVLVFDEYLTLKNPTKQVNISPPIEGKLDVRLKSKEVIITWEDTLQENTTYTISFGNAITDFTEGNANDKLKYVFSTGDFIDSLSLQGRVMDYKGEAVEDILVGLYDYSRVGNSDSIPFKFLPNYYAYTDESGSFEMDYLKYGRYQVVAFKDQDGDFKMNSGIELTGFSSDTLHLDTTTAPLLLRVFEPEPTKRFLGPRLVSYGKLQLPFNYKIKTLQPQLLYPDSLKHLITYSPGHDTAIFWFDQEGLDSLKFLLQQPGVTDTVDLLIREFDKNPLKLTPRLREIKFNEPVLMMSNEPLNSVKHELMLLMAKDTAATDTAIINSPLELELPAPSRRKQFNLQVLPGAATSIFGNEVKDTLTYDFKILDKEELGSLLFTVIGDTAKTYVLLIKNPQGREVVRDTFKGSTSIDMRHSRPGTYSIQLVVDENGDGRWTTGNYLLQKQPERIITYPEQAEIRANWELELDWVVEEQLQAEKDSLKLKPTAKEEVGKPQSKEKRSRSDKN